MFSSRITQAMPFSIGLLAVTTLCTAYPASKTHSTHSPKPKTVSSQGSSSQWQPSKVLRSQLGEEVDLIGYHVHAPKGYTLQQRAFQNESDTGTTYIWKGALRADQTRPTFVIYVRTTVIGFHPVSSDKALDVFQTGVRENMQDFMQSSVQDGEINSLPFVRTYWKGTNTTTTHHMHGFTYTAVDDHTIITISCEDAEPLNAQTLPVAEAAAETFRSDQ